MPKRETIIGYRGDEKAIAGSARIRSLRTLFFASRRHSSALSTAEAAFRFPDLRNSDESPPQYAIPRGSSAFPPRDVSLQKSRPWEGSNRNSEPTVLFPASRREATAAVPQEPASIASPNYENSILTNREEEDGPKNEGCRGSLRDGGVRKLDQETPPSAEEISNGSTASVLPGEESPPSAAMPVGPAGEARRRRRSGDPALPLRDSPYPSSSSGRARRAPGRNNHTRELIRSRLNDAPLSSDLTRRRGPIVSVGPTTFTLTK